MCELLTFFISLIYYELLLRIIAKNGIFSGFFSILISSFFISCAICLISRIFRHKKVFTNIVLSIITILFLTSTLININFMSYMTYPYIFKNAANVVTGFGSEIITLITSHIPHIFLFLIPIFVFNILSIFLKYKNFKNILYNILLVLFSLILLIINVIIIGKSTNTLSNYNYNEAVIKYGLVIANILSPLQKKNATLTIENTTDTSEAKESKVETEANRPIEYNANLNIDFAKENENPDLDEITKNINTYLSTLEPSQKNDYTGLFKGKNLILICAESLTKVAIDKELTPTLYRLVHNGFDFTNYYAPYWGGSTGGGEYAFLTGLITTSWDTVLSNVTSKNMHFNIASKLKEIGYHTFAFHNGSYNFYHRHKSHVKVGFDKYIAFGNGLEDYIETKHDDVELFDKTFDIYKNEQPFCVYFMTYTGHYPYVESKQVDKYINKIKERYGDQYQEVVNGYLAKQLYLEYGLEKLLNHLTENNMLEDTVICMTTDHYPYPLDVKNKDYVNDENTLSNLYGIDFTNNNKFKKDENVLVLWSGALEGSLNKYRKNIDKVTYTMDAMPTLLNLFGLNFDSRLYPGRDVFCDGEGLAIYNNYSFITDKVYYNASNKSKVSLSEEDVDDDYIKKYSNIVTNKINYCKNFIECNYYEYFSKLEKSTN